MSKHLAAHPEFIKSFVYECFSNGFNEKQASELLSTYAKAEFYKTDKDFKEGVDSFFKQSNVPKATWNLIKALGSAGKNNLGITAPILAGAAGGALAPEGVLPENFQGGAMSGAALGALLGAIGTKGKGLGSSLGRIGKSISKGGVGRTALGEAGRVITNKSILKSTGKGALGGLAAAGTSKLMNQGLGGLIPGRKPSVNSDTGMPWYLNEDNNAEGYQTASDNLPNPFGLPAELLARVNESSPNRYGASNKSGPIGDLTNKKNQLLELENQISETQRALPSGSTPTSYRQRQSLQSELDNLKMQRNQLVGNIGSLEKTINTDKSNMFNSAAKAQQLAERGLTSTRNEFDTLRRRQQIAEQGGILGNIMNMYNSMSGVNNRLSELDPIYSSYENELDKARRLQELAQ